MTKTFYVFQNGKVLELSKETYTSLLNIVTYWAHGRVVIGSKCNLTNHTMFGVLRLVLGKGYRCSLPRVTVQVKGSLVEDHTKFIENSMRGTVLVHPLMCSTVHLESDGEFVNIHDLLLTVTAFLGDKRLLVVDVGLS